MIKYKLTVAYDGTSYGGWQIQPNAISIQELIEKALSTILRAPTKISGSGRTDAGVHALGQTAHFVAEQLEPGRVQKSLNGLLPPDIRILQIEEVESSFHARYTASSKEYHYHLASVIDPFNRLYAYHPHTSLDINLLQSAAQCFIGSHDFTSFANDSGDEDKSFVRTIFRLDCCPEEKGIRLEFEGDGFLYKMVRNITGTLVAAASGKLPVDEIPRIFDAKDRRKAPAAAPALGLFLVNVNYNSLKEEKTGAETGCFSCG